MTSDDVYSALESVAVDDIVFDSENENEPSDNEDSEHSEQENNGRNRFDEIRKEVCLFAILFSFPIWLQ